MYQSDIKSGTKTCPDNDQKWTCAKDSFIMHTTCLHVTHNKKRTEWMGRKINMSQSVTREERGRRGSGLIN